MKINYILNYFIENSIFTERQISIIYNKLNNTKSKRITKGAYYRQVKQCRKKIDQVLFSIILLHTIHALEQDSIVLLKKVMEQIDVIINSHGDIITSQNTISSVIDVINQIIPRMNKL